MRILGKGLKSGRRQSLLGGATVALSAFLIMLVAALGIAAQENAERSQVQRRMQATATLAQAYVSEQTSGLAALVTAYGDRLKASGALDERAGSKASISAITSDLEQLAEARPGIIVTFLTDARGVLLAVHPATPAQLGKNFAFRDWYRGAVRSGGPYISEAYQTLAVDRPFVIAASVAVRSSPAGTGREQTQRVLSATYGLSSFQKFVDGYAARTGIQLLILDQRGVLIADGGHPPRPGTSLKDRREAGRRAVEAQGFLSAKITDRDTGWTVVSQVPLAAALAPASTFRGVVLIAVGLLTVLLVGGSAAAARIRRQRRRAREDIDRFFSLSLDLLCIASTDGFFKQVNPAWQDVLGYEDDELLGQPFVNFIHPDDLEATAAEVVKLMGGEPSVAFENRYRCKDGSYRWLLWKIAPLPDQNLMYAVARDNTERRGVEHASAQLAAIVDSSVDAIAGADLGGMITSWNRGAERIFGYRPDEIVGQPMNVLAAAGDDSQKDLVARAGRGEVIAPYEATRVRRDGQLIEVALTTSSVRDAVGAVIGMSMIARDITEGRRASEALRAIIATASDGFVSMDGEGVITEWNHRAEALFGWARDEVLGRELAAVIIPKEQRGAHRAGLRRVLGGGEKRILDQLIEIQALHRDGRLIPVELAVWRVSSGPVEQFSAFVRDITERQQIARDVLTARDQALEASRLKSAFLANMSHEIRTPMNGVIGLSGLLLNSDLADTQRRYVDGIRIAGNALLGVINDILDFSKIEAGALVLDDAAVNLGEVLEEVVELVSETARGKGLELLGFCDPSLPGVLRGDPVRIRQILLNLASNAVKFTDHGEVFIHIHPATAPSRRAKDPVTGPDKVGIRFEVTDTGIGIDPAAHAQLFDPFAQADSSTTRRFGGTGLGLAICRELVEAMGGQLGLESQPGQGSTFWCVIPLRADANSAGTPIQRDANLQGRRVLVVDDNETNRLILTQQLTAWAMVPTVLNSGQQALDHLQAASTGGEFYDVAIVDMHMPGLDGLELARLIQQLNIPPLPIVLASSGEQVAVGTATDAGIVAFLSKPIQQSQLHDCLVTVAAGRTQATRTPHPAHPVEPVTETPSLGQLLLVEDNEINQMVAVGILTELGYGVDVAYDGLQALELAGRNPYDAVLMDCQMPNMDGYEATGEFRRRERLFAVQGADPVGSTFGRHTPIIAMTAAALKEDRDRCLAAGMDDYLTKPILVDVLAAVLARWTTDGTSAPAIPVRGSGTSVEGSILDRLAELGEHSAAGLVPKLVTSFLRRAPGYLLELTNTLHREDFDAFAQAAHGLNGAAGNLGATTMASLCLELEDLGHQAHGGQEPSSTDLLDRLRLEYEAVRTVLEDLQAAPSKIGWLAH